RRRVMAADYYDLLRITPAATFSQVHKAYRTLAMLYHPDRNPTPEAGSMMAAINEAYSVLSDSARRREYDRRYGALEPFDFAGPILRAAYETILKQGWNVTESSETALLLEQGLRTVRVTFLPRADNRILQKLARQATVFCVVMAVEVETPFNLSFTMAVID